MYSEDVVRPLSFVVGVQLLSCVQLFMTPWTTACQAPLSLEFSRQEYWSRLLFPSPRDHPNPGTEPTSSALAGGSFTAEPPRRPFFPQSEIKEIVNCSVGRKKKQESSIPCYDHLPVMKAMRQWVHSFCLKQTVGCEIKGRKKRLSVFIHGARISAFAIAHG